MTKTFLPFHFFWGCRDQGFPSQKRYYIRDAKRDAICLMKPLENTSFRKILLCSIRFALFF